MGKQDDGYFGIVHRAEQAQLKAERSPAPNTPTPELIERLKSHDLNTCPDWSDENDKRQWIDTADALLSEAAAAIASLTAERDKWRDAWMKSAHDEAEAIRERDEATAERDALKENISVWHSYVREGLGISGEDLPFRFDYYAQEIAAVIAANKLLSERVAVLETALEPFADEAKELAKSIADDTVYSIDGYEVLGFSEFTVGDLRRALAAREAK